MNAYEPPCRMTNVMVSLLAEVCEQIGRCEVLPRASVQLQHRNRIRTIHSSLGIEHNTLSLHQVTAILDGKRVIGPADEIREVENAGFVYRQMESFHPLRVKDLLRAHGLMMRGLIRESGRFRSGSVGVTDGKRVIHVAPPASMVAGHIGNLLAWYRTSPMHPLLKSAVFHYEFEFIHPFADGNGRMGRLWHTLLLGAWKPLFFHLPVEEILLARQQEYYDALAQAGACGESSCFVELMLRTIRDTLTRYHTDEKEMPLPQTVPNAALPPLQRLAAVMQGDESLSAVELMARLGLTHRTHFRKQYLTPALQAGLIRQTLPDSPNSRYQRYILVAP